MPASCDPEFWPVVQHARQTLATYTDMEELIRLGAYKLGSNPEVDAAIALFPKIDEFLRQGKKESTSMRDSYDRLAEIMSGAGGVTA
jgi:flagellum-specific ATP synthase